MCGTFLPLHLNHMHCEKKVIESLNLICVAIYGVVEPNVYIHLCAYLYNKNAYMYSPIHILCIYPCHHESSHINQCVYIIYYYIL
jgi:nicotinic acid mononucleotide adenylyltransferase